MKTILYKIVIIVVVLLALILVYTKPSMDDNIKTLKTFTLISYADKDGNKFSQVLSFQDQCNIRIERIFPMNKRRTIHIPLDKMLASRTRIVMSDYDADMYWKAGEYSLEVKTESVQQHIKIIDQQGLLNSSDYAYIYIYPSNQKHANKIKHILVSLIETCNL